MDIPSDPLLFQAVIVPHRSLSRRSLKRLLAVICALCGASAAVFVWLGAWPVGGFTGIELLLAAYLFRLNAHGIRETEFIVLTGAGLRITRTDRAGEKRERLLNPAWLTITLEERPGRVPGLLVTGRDVRIEIGRSLGEDEKRDLAQALGTALHDLRHPIFDNPQLRG
jgi:uncharacterized membrane protein